MQALTIGPSRLSTRANVASCRHVPWLQLVVGIISSLLAQPVLAASGTTLFLPFNGKPTASGLSLSVDTRWTEGAGYRPIKFTFTSTPASVADRQISIDFRVYSMHSRPSMEVSKEVDIPAGSSTYSVTLPVPEYGHWNMFSFDIYEDGRHIPALSQGRSGMPMGIGNGATDSPSLLFVGNGMPDTTALRETHGGYYGSNQGMANANNHSLPIQELPEDWINYTGLDIVILSLNDLDLLQKQQPRKWQAITHWLRSGGNLWVYGVGEDWSRLADLEKLLDCLPDQEPAENTPQARGWVLANKEMYLQVLKDRGYNMPPTNDGNSMRAGPGYVQLGAVEVSPPQQSMGVTAGIALPEKPHFAMRDVQLGRVVAIAPENPFPGTADAWAWIFQTVGPERSLWHQRHGLTTTNGNSDFWNFLISGVGLPPVGSFRVLITLFVVVIGPVNYLLLRRYRRLHLLLFTVPASALVVTSSLLAFALLSDGVGVRLRARTYTQIDQQAGEAVSWSRLSYYAGLAPSQGMQFSADTAVFPLEFEPSWGYRGESVGRKLAWDENQRLTSGWLRSRTPMQYITIRARASRHHLIVAEPEAANGPVKVENQLDTRIQKLVLCDANGNLHVAQRIEPADKTSLTPVRLGDEQSIAALSAIRKQFLQSAPQTNPIVVRDADLMFSSRRYWRYGYSNVAASQDTSRLEMPLTQLKGELAVRHGRLQSGIESGEGIPIVSENSLRPMLGPRSYLAIVDRSPEASYGLDDVEEVESFHVVFGKW